MPHETTMITADGSIRPRHDDMPPIPAFIMGLMFGALALWLIQKWGARKVRRALGAAEPPRVRTAEVTELKDRIETLEAIITDKPKRLEREIEALRSDAVS